MEYRTMSTSTPLEDAEAPLEVLRVHRPAGSHHPALDVFFEAKETKPPKNSRQRRRALRAQLQQYLEDLGASCSGIHELERALEEATFEEAHEALPEPPPPELLVWARAEFERLRAGCTDRLAIAHELEFWEPAPFWEASDEFDPASQALRACMSALSSST